MEIVFDTIDKTGRRIRLTKSQWSHIRRDQPDVQEEDVEKTVINPIKIVQTRKPNKFFYYYYYKDRKGKSKYLRVIARYLNGDGFVVTAYFVQDVT